MNENILNTCVPKGAKMHEAEDHVDEQEAPHLDLCPRVSLFMLLHWALAVIPVAVHRRNIGAGDHVYSLLEPISSISKLFWDDQLGDRNCQRVKEEESSEGYQGPLSAKSRVQVVFGSFWVVGVFKIPPLLTLIFIKYDIN